MFGSHMKSRERRTIEQLRRHYKVEKQIANKLRRSTRAQRIQIMRTMYDELFAQVPDHPRLTARDAPKRAEILVARQMQLLARYLQPNHTFLEFGPGNCNLAIVVCSMVSRVYAVDISDTLDPSTEKPSNFNFLVYDGFDLDLPDESIHVVYSDQMVEHLHPDDTADHFRLVHRLLKPNGIYVFRTPHRLYGPHDISRYFSDVPECFHLKEWTFAELGKLVESLGFCRWQGCWCARGMCRRMPKWLLLFSERVISLWPLKIRRRIGPYLLPSITMVVKK